MVTQFLYYCANLFFKVISYIHTSNIIVWALADLELWVVTVSVCNLFVIVAYQVENLWIFFL